MTHTLEKVLSNKEENRLLPFLWMHSDRRSVLPGLVESIYKSGARAFCVESRPHEHFCEDEWWGDMEVLIAEARKRDMKIWILDDKHFPTGFANGYVAKFDTSLRRKQLIETHLNVAGPMPGCAILTNPGKPEDEELVCALAYKMEEDSEDITGEPVVLTDKVSDGMLLWDVPEGTWRVFFMHKSQRGNKVGIDYTDVLRPEGTDALIKAVYEEHYKHLGQYFGNTIAGFFSDEPSLGNAFVNRFSPLRTWYQCNVGEKGLALPWSDEIIPLMRKELSYDPTPFMGALWYPMNGKEAALRIAYMNAVTGLWLKNFSYRVGDWCRAHNVEYIGHIIEDNNAHGRTGASAGHYFRSLDGQDMGGIDVVLHQLMPGMAHYPHATTCGDCDCETEFFHYVLAKLASSHAHLQPHMKGRAMCETFGAYGWGEGTDLMKWMMDHLLVRGINHFVPHAFSPDYPDPDCPPHFSAEGHNPQFEAFSALMPYVNKVSNLMSEGRHMAGAAVLYHAEAEWSGQKAMLSQVPARVLYENQIDFSIVPIDYIAERARTANGKLLLENGETRDVLIIPGCEYLPENAVTALKKLHEQGLNIVFAEFRPESLEGVGTVLPVKSLPKLKGLHRITLDKPFKLLSALHMQTDEADSIMLVNEDPANTCDTMMTLPVSGEYTRVELQIGSVNREHTEDGRVRMTLKPYESVILVFDRQHAEMTKPYYEGTRSVLKPEFEVSAADSDALTVFKPVTEMREYSPAFGFTALMGARFSGKLRYTAHFSASSTVKALDLGEAGTASEVTLNGVSLGARMCPPHIYNTAGLVKDGENVIEITLSNTLGPRLRDPFTRLMPMPAGGLVGPVELIK